MKTQFKFTVVIAALVAAVIGGQPATGLAKDASSKPATQPKVSRTNAKKSAVQQAVPAGVTLNACGCYRTEAGACFCGDKNGACVCAGDCEPMACEQKRAKEMQREVAAETKRAQDDEKRRRDEAAAAEAAAAANRTESAPVSSGDSVVGDVDDNAAEKKADDKKADEPKPEKPAVKPRKRSAAK
jgi:hypothetical protein